MIEPFSVGRLPRIRFGAGVLAEVPALARSYGTRALVLTGARSFTAAPHGRAFFAALEQAGVSHVTERISGEPSPEGVDTLVARHRHQRPDVVIGVGGGSVLDAAKAVAGLLIPGNSVMDHLEGVGRNVPYRGPAVPFIAVPTTAGTGSEATKNAVLSRPGPDGFKKSFRDDLLVAQWAVVDPELLAGCPPEQIAANGMDAFTQLLESYVSARAGAFTDALAWDGMQKVRDGLFAAHAGGSSEAAAAGRAAMAYASLLSGVTLAQAGLGSVHGLASPLGAFFPIPHGVVCGTLLAAAAAANITALRARQPDHPALAKYARVGALLAGRPPGDTEQDLDTLVAVLSEWVERLAIPRLGAFGVRETDIPRIVAHSRGSSMRTNPIVLTDEEIAGILRERL